MSIDTLTEGPHPVKLWTPRAEVETTAMEQLQTMAKLPWVFRHIAVMPDVHWGMGCTVGSVIATKEAIAPAAVGVDIGCGMGAIRTNLTAADLPDSLAALRSSIEAAIPVGFNAHAEESTTSEFLSDESKAEFDSLMGNFRALDEGVKDLAPRANKQVGTLGGGNHFIEMCLDTDQRVWLMLHSGSRNIGKMLAEIHIGRAKKLAHNAELPDKDLAVFLAGTPEMEAYRRDLFWAQRYAFLNRQVMFDLYKNVVSKAFPQARFEAPILCHHNYVSEETHFGEQVLVTRKGAINAEKGRLGIIPGSMGARSFIVEGLGNPESFNSASHGAGRKMSRGKAKKTFTVADLEAQTAGVECRKDKDVLDEIPGAYKDIEQVMANQRDLVRVVAELKQVLCVKG